MTNEKELEDNSSGERSSLSQNSSIKKSNESDLNNENERDLSTNLDKEKQEVLKSEFGFSCFGFSNEIIETLEKKGYKEPSPIQKAAFPELMLGRDFVGQAQTGTGKTAAFAIPILERLKSNGNLPQVLVLTPTRELAMQVADSFRAYGAGHKHLRFLAVYGGADFRSQIYSLKKGVDVIVGTPGRVMDHIRQGTLNTNELKCLVLDEADEMLRMGFIDDVEWVLEQLPNERQMILFSATMPSEIRRLSKNYLKDPAEITIKSKKKESKLIRQRFICIQNSYKIETLKRILEAITSEGVIIFTRTKAITLNVSEALEASGHDVAVLNGDVPQSQRERTVERLRSGVINILVATDVAARGLDVERICLVINYDMPFDSEAYVHRIGRTGRAGRSGEAILFVNPREKHFLKNLERAVGQEIEQMPVPSNSDINNSRILKLEKSLIESVSSAKERTKENEIISSIINKVKESLQIDEQEIALASLNIAVGKAPLLSETDESWIKQANSPRNRRGDKRDDRNINSRRKRDRNDGPLENNMERFRVEVGHRDRVKPGNLVGAIANETGLQGRSIGRIQIFDNYSFVDLPKGMPDSTFNELKKLKVMNRELQIQRA